MNRRFLRAWRLTLAGAAVVVLAVLAGVATGCGNSSVSVIGTGTTTEPNPHAKAPDFSAESLGGGTLALTDLVAAGKPILITFGASW
ncbi:MAG: TlpA family protein disulfide reductase [Thermoleophilia bacterium]